MHRSRKGFMHRNPIVITWTIIAFAVQSVSAMAAEQGIVVLGTEQDIRKDKTPLCLGKAIKKAEPERRIIPARQFRNALFPFFEPGTAPKSAWELSMVLGKSEVQERINKLGVRYLVVASGRTRSSSAEGAMVCPWGCYGVATIDKLTHLAVLIWDLQNIKDRESLDVAATGKTVVPAFILPIPFIANTKRKACNLMAEEVSSFIKNENLDTAIRMSTEEIGPAPSDVE